jgi:putative chitinase
MLTILDLKSIMPAAPVKRIELFLPWLNKYMMVYEVNTSARKCAFLANVGHESLSLHYVKEIASGKAYEGRKDLGNIVVGDGVKFKGRGLIQITGRDNYMKCSRNLFGNEKRLIESPELLEQPQYAVQSACWFWNDRAINQRADKIDTELPLVDNNLQAFKAVVKRVNGGYNGLADRIESFSASVPRPEDLTREPGHPNSSNYQKPSPLPSGANDRNSNR